MLDVKEFKIMIHSNFPNEKADIIAKYMKHKYFIKSEEIYCISDHISYNRGSKNYTNKLLNATSKLLQKSFKSLDDVDQGDVSSNKKFANIFNNINIKTYLPQLTESITDDSIELDNYLDEIHFVNGVYDLKSENFSKREIGKHYITNYIKYAYAETTAASRNAF